MRSWQLIFKSYGGVNACLKYANAVKSEAEASELRINLETATNQLAMLTQENARLNLNVIEIQSALASAVDQILSRLTNNPSEVINNSCYTAVTSNTLFNIQKILVAVDEAGNTNVIATNEQIQAKINQASNILLFHQAPTVNTPQPGD
jgi:hypothetical protein